MKNALDFWFSVSWGIVLIITFIPFFQQSDLDKANNKLTKTKEKYDQELEELQKKKDGEITELKQQLQTHESTIKERTEEVTAAKQSIDQLTTDADNLKVGHTATSVYQVCF